MKTICTYVVKHEKPAPAVSANTEINGGKLQAVMFDDALQKLEEVEDLLESIKLHTQCSKTLRKILDHQNKQVAA